MPCSATAGRTYTASCGQWKDIQMLIRKVSEDTCRIPLSTAGPTSRPSVEAPSRQVAHRD